MKKLKKRIVFFIILTIFLTIIILKIYYFIVMDKISNSFKNFIKQENRYYCVIEIFAKQNKRKFSIREIYRKNSELKYLKLDINANNIFFELRNFQTDRIYVWKNGKVLDENEASIIDENIIFNTPNIINTNKMLSLENLLKIHYIKSRKYNDKACYEIVTKSEIIVVSKDNYLPIYMCKKDAEGIKDRQTVEIEYFYSFEIGTVTDENMQVP